MFNHEMTTSEHRRKLILPKKYTKHELRYNWYVPDPTSVTPSYDLKRATVEEIWYPVCIISAEKLVVPKTGLAEGWKIAELIYGKEDFEKWMIDKEASDATE